MCRYDDETPEQWVECGKCNGSGIIVRRITVYEHGCGFPHDDGEEVTCDECDGTGGHVEEMRPDSEGDYCPYRHFTDEESEGWERVFEGVKP